MGHEAVHAVDIGMGSAPDIEIIDRARREERIILTGDLDYPRLLAITTADQPGVILFRGGDYDEQETISQLTKVLASISPPQLARSIVVVERFRIRRRSLPVT